MKLKYVAIKKLLTSTFNELTNPITDTVVYCQHSKC